MNLTDEEEEDTQVSRYVDVNKMIIENKITKPIDEVEILPEDSVYEKDQAQSVSDLEDINQPKQIEDNGKCYVTLKELCLPENSSYLEDTCDPMRNVKFKVKGVPEMSSVPNGLPPLNNIVNVDFDDVLQQLGEFGLYQKLMFLSMILFSFAEAFVYFAQIFITVVPEHWCRIPELSHLNNEQR